MSGFGIREQFELMKSFGEELHWREESFLQQLSQNGSMLWMPNHNENWLSICNSLVGEENTGWTTLRERFQAYPAGETRRILYQTSLVYYRHLSEAYNNFLKASFLSSGRTNEIIKEIEKDLLRMEIQLKNLEWCATDTGKGRIKVLKALPSAEK